jgi:hypothetical protein
VHERDRHAAFTDCCRHALDGAESDVTAGEDAWDARLEEVGISAVEPLSGLARVRPRENVARWVQGDLGWEPGRLGIRADEE